MRACRMNLIWKKFLLLIWKLNFFVLIINWPDDVDQLFFFTFFAVRIFIITFTTTILSHMKVKWNKKNCFSHHMTWCDLFSMEFYFDIKWSKDFKWDFEAVFSKFCNDLRSTSFISLKIQKFWSKVACKA